MNEKQTIVATQKIYNYEVRVVTGLIAVRFREDGEYTDSDGILKKFKAGDINGYDHIEGKYGYEVYDEFGIQRYFSSGYEPVELYPEWYPEKHRRLPKFKTIKQAMNDAEGMIESFLEWEGEAEKHGAQTQQDREFYRPLSGWGEPDDWEGGNDREDPRLSGNCWTCWKHGIGG
jgi:hypothetical protein